MLVETVTGIQTVKATRWSPPLPAAGTTSWPATCQASFKTQNLATWAHEGVNLIGKLVNAATCGTAPSW
jgi:subfamily B ATP-binding cassette protein HlyB/CyaB